MRGNFTMAVSDVMKMVKDNNVKFVDFRFTDTKGKEQHVSVPVSAFDEDKFKEGHAFDGSSIAGWKAINESDMKLMPDCSRSVVDPFYSQPTLAIFCDVLDPNALSFMLREYLEGSKNLQSREDISVLSRANYSLANTCGKYLSLYKKLQAL